MTDEFKGLQKKCAACKTCPLSLTRQNTVFGMGNPKAPLLIVGEGPGEQEDKQGLPFVGPAGKLLDDFLQVIDLTREDCYITNIVKCRPPKNRDPLPAEQEACLPFLREQVRYMRPKIILCLGRVAAQALIDPNFRVTRDHGKLVNKKGTLMMGTFHPSALLRNPGNRPDALEDFVALREVLSQLKHKPE